jgi:hypothetical protein
MMKQGVGHLNIMSGPTRSDRLVTILSNNLVGGQKQINIEHIETSEHLSIRNKETEVDGDWEYDRP